MFQRSRCLSFTLQFPHISTPLSDIVRAWWILCRKSFPKLFLRFLEKHRGFISFAQNPIMLQWLCLTLFRLYLCLLFAGQEWIKNIMRSSMATYYKTRTSIRKTTPRREAPPAEQAARSSRKGKINYY